MTAIDRSTERRLLIAVGILPDMDRRPGIARRIWKEITPDDGTLTTRLIVRFRTVVFVAFLCALSAVAGARLADRTAPGACLVVDQERCAFELTPHRDGTVTVRLNVSGMDRHEDRMPMACIRPGPKDPALACPDWVVNWQGQT